jgi:hypothetical protein
MKDSPNYKILPANEMSLEELTNWFSFLNAIKFISVFCKKKGIDPDTIELDSREIAKYIQTTSGDILTNLQERFGVPLKYSLDPSCEEAKSIEEIQYQS